MSTSKFSGSNTRISGTPLSQQSQSVATANIKAQILATSSGRAITPAVSGVNFRDIADAAPLVGNYVLRTVSLADRLKQPAAQEARDYATATRASAIEGLLALADDFLAEDGESAGSDGLSGLFRGVNVHGLDKDPFLVAAQVNTRFLAFSEFIKPTLRNTLIGNIRSLPSASSSTATDPAEDEGRHFSTGIDLGDNSIALVRQMEGRVAAYRSVIAKCQAALDATRGNLDSIGSAVLAAENSLGEARHDTATALALQAEEQARIDGINTRRAQVLAEEVRFLAYIRPRATDNLGSVPRRALDPGLVAAPIPECLRSHAEAPAELQSLLAVVRESPGKWFIATGPLLDRLDRVDLLTRVVQAGQQRSQFTLVEPTLRSTSNKLGLAVARVASRQAAVVRGLRQGLQEVDTRQLAALSWQGLRKQVEEVVSLGDLIDGAHGNHDLARRAAAEFARFSEICTCLHAEFGTVPAVIRLVWAELLSEYDEAPSLRNLASLPRFGEIAFVDRKRLQAFTDWLFSQVRSSIDEAESLINDVVRICLLLASHAPVDQIIAGRLPRPVTARPGVRIPLTAFDISRLRIGMHALVYRGNELVTRAVIDDLGSTELTARVLETRSASEELDSQLRVQFADAATVSATRRGRR